VRQMYRRAAGHEEHRGEEVVIAGLADAFEASGFSIKRLVVEIAMSDGFRYAGDAR